MFNDSAYTIFFVLSFLLATGSQLWITSSYSKNSKIQPKAGITGEEAALKIVEGENFNTDITISGRSLSDHYDPRKDLVVLSTSSKNSSVADIAVTAHEFGHVSQRYSKSLLFNLRNGLVPIVNIGSNIGYILIILGFTLSIFELAQLGLILFSTTALFAFLTVPLEMNATKRGLAFIKKYKLIESENIPNAKSVLNAAAMTYVASLLTSLLNVLYFASRIRRK